MTTAGRGVSVRELGELLDRTGGRLARMRRRDDLEGDAVSLFVLVRGAEAVAAVEDALDAVEDHWRRQEQAKR